MKPQTPKTYWVVLHVRTRKPLSHVYDTKIEAKQSCMNFHKKNGVVKNIEIREIGR